MSVCTNQPYDVCHFYGTTFHAILPAKLTKMPQDFSRVRSKEISELHEALFTQNYEKIPRQLLDVYQCHQT